jgi:hypothetical protein
VKVGVTGYGKSQQVMLDIVSDYLPDRPHAVLHLDYKGTTVFGITGHLVAGGAERFVEFEQLSSPDQKCLAWEWLEGATATEPFLRGVEEELFREEFKQIWYGKKGLATDEAAGFTREGMDLAVSVMQAQRPPKPLPWMRKVFYPSSAEFEALREHCSYPDVAERLAASFRLWYRSPTQYDVWSGAARRLLDPLESASVQARCNPSPGAAFDWMRAFRERRYIGVSGAGIARPVFRTIALAMTLQAVHCCRRFHAQYRAALPVLVVLEEAGANKLANVPFILSALQEGRESGIAFDILTQSLQDLCQ